jgi:hypothetical protein
VHQIKETKAKLEVERSKRKSSKRNKKDTFRTSLLLLAITSSAREAISSGISSYVAQPLIQS